MFDTQQDKDRFTMGAFIVFNAVMLWLARNLSDNMTGCDKSALEAANWLLIVISISLGASIMCLISNCASHTLTLGLLGVSSIVSLGLASYVHSKCDSIHHYSTPIIVINVLLVAAAIATVAFFNKGAIKQGVQNIRAKVSRQPAPAAAAPGANFGYNRF